MDKIKLFLRKIFGLTKCVWKVKLYDENGNVIDIKIYKSSCIYDDVTSFSMLYMFRNNKAESFSVEYVGEE
jgi:hypothetical protein